MTTSTIEAQLQQLQEDISNCENFLLQIIQGKKIMVTNVSLNAREINTKRQQTPIAIISMASIFPQAKNLQEYWENITFLLLRIRVRKPHLQTR
jgi:hypothetical protein